ncbi:CD4-1 molecule [Aulostomus maculatus]
MNPASLLLPGESLSLTCDVETPQYGTAPKVSWLNPQGKIYYGVSEAGFAKLPLSVTSQDNGQWTCVVVNDGKESKATISVSVFYLFPIPENPQYLPESQPLTIPCSLPRSISWSQIQTRDLLGVHWEFTPKPSSGLTPERPQRLFTLSLDPLTWKVNQSRELSPVSAPSTGNMSLSGKKARERDRGDYVCTFEFKNGWTLNRTVRVEVLRIVSSPGTEVTSGKQIDLSCSLGRELPSDLHLKWIPPEHSSLQSLTFDHHSTLITIPEAGTGDSGMWRCELWQSNTLLTSAVITLKINPKLSVWMLVTIGGGIVIIVLLILLFILRQCRQQKMRHPRHRFCQCKNPKPKGFYRT